jgi:hypothetical protein
MTIRGRVTLGDSRQGFEEMIGLMRDGRLYLLAVYAGDVEFTAAASENLLQQKAVGDFFSHALGGALAFACGNEVAFGTSRQFQMMASNSKVRIGVFRDGEEAEAWILAGLAVDRGREAVTSDWMGSP